MKYQLIASGTFDLLHRGHMSFLEKSLDKASEVIVCITSDSYVNSFKEGKDIEGFESRRQAVVKFLESMGAKDKTKIISIDDIYGPLLTTQYNPQAIAVTPENEKTAEKINEEREKKGLPRLEIKVIEMESAQDGGVISSTRIRLGEINREGRLYIQKKWLAQSLILPGSLRPQLQKPFGKLLDSVPLGLDTLRTITIGDITTQKFNEKKTRQFLSIIDFQVHRKKTFDSISRLGFEEEIETVNVENPAGTITPSLFEFVQKAFGNNDRKIILILGEEDLAVLPVLLVSPLGYKIFYGQPPYAKASEGKPSEGLVEVLVTEEIKEKAYELVNQFSN